MEPAPSSLPPTDEEPAYRVFLDSLEYLSPADVDRIKEAYAFSARAHASQKRMSGEPYITHPLAVAGAVVEWRMDAEAVIAALLHDVLEDTGTSKRELADKFGREVADLVDGLSKLDKMEFASYQVAQAENFRKMLMAMARDLRVVLIKLADRQHNLQTMAAMRPDKRRRIAMETLDIYAPIALRLGLALERAQFDVLLVGARSGLLYLIERRAQRADAVAGDLGVVLQLARQALALHADLAVDLGDLRLQFLDARVLVEQRGRLLGELRAQRDALLDQPPLHFDVRQVAQPLAFQAAQPGQVQRGPGQTQRRLIQLPLHARVKCSALLEPIELPESQPHHHGDGGDGHNFIHAVTRLQHVHRCAHSQQNRSDRLRTAQAPHQLIGHVGRLKIGENQHVGILDFAERIACFD